MLFFSLTFLAFFAVVFPLYWLLPWQRARTGWLLAASLLFYASWNPWLTSLIVVSTTVDWALARAIAAEPSERGKTRLVTLSVVMNLGLLTYFKYANFFLRTAQDGLRAAGVPAVLPALHVILPIGISFYTFEAISYVVDVRRGRVVAERSLARFMLFITFFPHLVAGPIVRPWFFLPQLRRLRRWSWPRLRLGLEIFLVGLFKKVALADRLALFADPVFAHPGSYGSAAVWAAVLAYPLQIYCDFSGYSDMAIGLAHLFGYKLPRNFDAPYLAASVSEYWRRWHISLSTWLRDYLYVPLGGNRSPSAPRRLANLIVTMTLGGLWHGAALTFVLWGFLHGVWMAIERGLGELARCLPALGAAAESRAGTVLRVAGTFLLVTLGFVLFRSTTLAGAGEILSRLAAPHAGRFPPLPRRSLAVIAALIVAEQLAVRFGLGRRLDLRVPAPARGFAYAALACATLLLAPASGKTFIYFQF